MSTAMQKTPVVLVRAVVRLAKRAKKPDLGDSSCCEGVWAIGEGGQEEKIDGTCTQLLS